METFRKNAVAAGILLLLGFSGVATMATYGPLLSSQDYLTLLSARPGRVLLGVAAYLVMALACGGIAVALYPVLKRHSAGLALGAAGFRLAETPMQILGASTVVLLLTLSREFVKAGSPPSSHYQTIGALLWTANDWIANVGIILPWAVGAFMYHWVFFRTKLVPRWLSGWGLLGVPVIITGCVLVIFGVIDTGTQTFFNLPLGLQEIPLALWLIIKGFNREAVGGLSNKAALM